MEQYVQEQTMKEQPPAFHSHFNNFYETSHLIEWKKTNEMENIEKNECSHSFFNFSIFPLEIWSEKLLKSQKWIDEMMAVKSDAQAPLRNIKSL